MISRRNFVIGCGAAIASPSLAAGDSKHETFLFISDIHACRMGIGLSANCFNEGKTDANLLRHVKALNGLAGRPWPITVGDSPTNLPSAGKQISVTRGIVVGGDMTDDGGGQTAEPTEGSQILQFARRYQEGKGPDMVHYPVYAGLGNHDLDQDGRPPDIDWYRQEMRDYVRITHESSVFFKAMVPVTNFDPLSESYSWDWGELHLIQLHRFGGDTRKGAISALPWISKDLQTAGTRPIVLFQHYGWDSFSLERWNPKKSTFDDVGSGEAHWWSPDEQNALLDTISGSNAIGIFHGHEHETPMIYRHGTLDIFKPKAAYLGGFAVAKYGQGTFEVVLGEAIDDRGGVMFTNSLFKAVP
ncbi:MAG: metallophosphoesterase [Rhizobiaceae bacterium]|nr:metallophosphoesterase [Rhizobiaceae bacterium]